MEIFGYIIIKKEDYVRELWTEFSEGSHAYSDYRKEYNKEYYAKYKKKGLKKSNNPLQSE